jgi:hypothetical protein
MAPTEQLRRNIAASPFGLTLPRPFFGRDLLTSGICGSSAVASLNVHGGHRRRGEHQTIPISTRHNSTNMDPIQAAIKAYESQEPGEQLVIQEVADNYSVWRSTMQRRRRMAGQIVPRAEQTTNTRKLSPQQEDELFLYI